MGTYESLPLVSNLPKINQGRGWDLYGLSDPETLLLVATERLKTRWGQSESIVPGQDQAFLALTVYWLALVLGKFGIPHHMLSYGRKIYEDFPELLYNSAEGYANLHRRAIVVRKLETVPIYFNQRIFLVGSLYNDYYKKGLPDPYGLKLSVGLSLMSELPEPVLTAVSKSRPKKYWEEDKAIVEHLHGSSLTNEALLAARAHLNSKGFELATSKFEVGKDTRGKYYLVGEVLNPTSSRICRISEFKREAKVEPPWMGRKPLDIPSGEGLRELGRTYIEFAEEIIGMPLRQFQRTYLD